MFPLRCVGGFQRTSKWEDELDVEMTSWGTVGAEGWAKMKRVEFRPPPKCCLVKTSLSGTQFPLLPRKGWA